MGGAVEVLGKLAELRSSDAAGDGQEMARHVLPVVLAVEVPC
jgi:hypothetical protein